MKKIDKYLKDAFTNAMQLSIRSTVSDSTYSDDETTDIIFAISSFDGLVDDNFEKLKKLLPIIRYNRSIENYEGDLSDNHFFVVNFDNQDIEKLTSFLMLTRLVDENIIALVKKDRSYEQYALKLGLFTEDKSFNTIISVENCSQIIFEEVKKKKLTLRKLSEKTGLTQTMLSQFKSGRDIRLSNLLKITKALNLDLKM